MRRMCSDGSGDTSDGMEMYDAIQEYQVQQLCCDALLIVSTSREYFTVLDRDLRQFPDRELLVKVVGKCCLKLLMVHMRVRSKSSRGTRGYSDSGSIIGMTFPEAPGISQAIRGTFQLFKSFLIDINLSFWPCNEQGWNFCLESIEIAFADLAQGLEGRLAHIQRDAKVKHNDTVGALVQGMTTLHVEI